MSDVKTSKFKEFINIAYKIYHFVAKVILYSILIILVLVAIGFTAYFVDLAHNIKNGSSKTPLLGAYIIISPSMVPTIKVEDAVIIKRKEPEELKVGDIITFLSSDSRYSGLTITHRIVGIEKSEKGNLLFRTKGDNNSSEDSALVPSKNIYGKVILKIPKIGYIQYILTQSYGWLLLIVFPCLCIVVYDIVKLIKSIKNNITPNKQQLQNQEKKVIDVIGDSNQTTKKEDKDDDIEII